MPGGLLHRMAAEGRRPVGAEARGLAGPVLPTLGLLVFADAEFLRLPGENAGKGSGQERRGRVRLWQCSSRCVPDNGATVEGELGESRFQSLERRIGGTLGAESRAQEGELGAALGRWDSAVHRITGRGDWVNRRGVGSSAGLRLRDRRVPTAG